MALNVTVKNSIFNSNFQINCKGKLISLEFPIVMGIINATPDSFYSESRKQKLNDALLLTKTHLSEGATLIDIGGYSSRPGADDISIEEELNRVIPLIKEIVVQFPDALISIDTFRREVAEAAIIVGAAMVNDISAGELDKTMIDFIAESKVPYCMMHMKGTPQTMQQFTHYEDILKEVTYFFSEKVAVLSKKGISDVILDPGFGFAKTMEQNYQLLHHLDHFKLFNLPILAGLSRKSMLYKPLGITANEALNVTTVANSIALSKGAKIVRVHDVKPAIETIEIMKLCHQL